ncbi:MAG: T9SS type A sorting domain-containing protein [Prolixibacteraceae bacterium]
MNSRKILMLVIAMTSIAILAKSQNKSYIVPINSLYLDATSSSYSQVLPGDTLLITGGVRAYLGLVNFKGTASKPIIVKNVGSACLLNTTIGYGISVRGCQYLKILGDGVKGVQYGFQVDGTNGTLMGIDIGYLSSDIEVGFVSVKNVKSCGIVAKTDPACGYALRGTFTQFNTIIHDSYVAYTVNEGMYVGNSKYTDGMTFTCNGVSTVCYPNLLDGVQIYNNIVEYTGWDGIQVGCASLNCNIYGNTIRYDSQSGMDTQMSGILINNGTKANVYNNYIVNGKGDGIDVLGLGDTKVFNNIIVNPGYLYATGNQSLPKHGIYIGNQSVEKDKSLFVFNNNIINPKSDGIRYASNLNVSNFISSNVMICPTGSYVNNYFGTPNLTLKNNYTATTGTLAGFVNSAMFDKGDFALLSASTLINAGDVNPLVTTTFDFAGNTRSISDIGAYEYQGTGVTQSGGTIASGQSLCLGSAPSAFTSAAPASGLTGTPEYKWQMSATGVAGSFTDIAGSNALTYAPGTVNTTTSFIRLARTAGSADWNAAVSSNIVTITVNPLPAASAGTDRTISPGSSTQIGATAVSGSTYSWTSSPAGFTSTSANPTVTPTVTTTYTLKETVTATGCTNTHSVTVTLSAIPAAIAGANRSICQGTSTQIGATAVTGNTYNWTSSPAGFTSTAANPIVSPTVTTTYTLTETITATGSSNSHAVVVTVNPLPAAVAGTDRTICQGTSTQIGATAVSGSTYNWTSSPAGFTSTAANPTVSPLVTTTYSVVETITASGCTNTHSVTVTVSPTPAATAGTSRSIISGASTQIGATAVTGSTYSWTSSPAGFTSTAANPTVSPTATTTYTLVETVTATGCTNNQNVMVTVGSLPAAVAGADRSICLNSSTQIGATAVSGSTFSWTSSPAGFTSTLANPTVSPTVTTTYTLVETVTATGSTNSHAVVVTVNPLPAAVAGTNRSIVSGASTQIGAVAVTGSTYSWTSSPAGFTSTVANPSVSPTATTTYTLVETVTATGCTNTHAVTVSLGSLPAAAAGADRSICLKIGTQIGASSVSGSTFSWTSSPAGFTSTVANPVVYPTVTTTYTVVETVTATGSTNSHSMVVTVNPLPTAATGTDRAICQYASTQIGAASVAGSSYSWTSNPTGFTSTLANPVASPSVTTTYNLVETVTATGCTWSHNVTAIVNPAPMAVAGSNVSIEPNSSVQIGAAPVSGNTYKWTSSSAGFTSTIANPTVTPLVTTTYTLVETNTSKGCSNSNSVVVTVNSLPKADAGTDRAICMNSSTQLGAAAVSGSTYNWASSPAGFTSTLANPAVAPAVTTTYIMVETNAATGMTNSHQVVVTVNPLPTASAGSDRCINMHSQTQIGDVSVTGSTYHWTSNPTGINSTESNPSITPLVTTICTLSETSAMGCTNSNAVKVTVNPLPEANAGTDRAICLNSSTQLGAATVLGSTYSWTSNPAGFTSSLANPTVSPVVTTTYTLVETITATGSTNNHQVVVTVNPLPLASAGADRSICSNSPTQIGSASVNGSTYNWTSIPAGFTSSLSNPDVSPSLTTTYTLVETSATGCTNTNMVKVTVNPLPAANAGPNRSICLNTGTQIGASAVPGSTYTWTSVPAGYTSASSNPVVYPTVTTTYTLTETNTTTGCSNSHAVVVTVNPLPAASVGVNRAICTGTSTQIGAVPVTGSNYSWTSIPAGFTSTLANPTVSPIVNTTYNLVETVAATGCSWSHNVTVSVNPAPAAPSAITGTKSLCAGSTVILSDLTAGGIWSSSVPSVATVSSNGVITGISAGSATISYTVTSAGGCTNSVSAVVTVNSPALQPGNFTAGPSSVSYGQYYVVYTVPFIAGVTYKWSYSGKGATIQGTTNSVKVSFSYKATAGTLSVTASNGCGTSIPRSMNITMLKGAILPDGEILPDSTGLVVSDLKINANIPEAINQLNVYPNPSSGSTNFVFQVGEDAKVTLDIFNMSGQRMATVYNDNTDAGSIHQVMQNLSLPSGVYPCIMKWKGKMLSTKLMIVK